jgi:acyl-CoA thioesterase I
LGALSAGQAAASSKTLSIVAFGDSLTAGKDLPDPDRQAYPGIVERELRKRGYAVTVMNAGHSGDTTYDALARLDYTLQDRPDIVLVAFGNNDVFQGKDLAAVERNLDALVRRIQSSGALVILCGMKTLPNFGRETGKRFEEIFPRVARRRGAVLAPFFLNGVAGVASLNLPDGIHPNAAGHERMAKNLLGTVERSVRARLGTGPVPAPGIGAP